MLVEISLTSTDAFALIERSVTEFDDAVVIGAGTVLTAEDARRSASAGARFVLTPALCPGAVTAIDEGLPLVAGAFTPSEILQATNLGAAAVKVFPASLGGPGYIRSLREPFPHVPLVPVGGISADDVAAYLAAGALAVGVGAPLLGDAADGGSQHALSVRAAAFAAAARSQAGCRA